MSSINDITLIRKKKHAKYLITKSLNKYFEKKRSSPDKKIVNFFKKTFFTISCNLTEHEIKLIPGIYRFRCNVYEIDETQIKSKEVDHMRNLLDHPELIEINDSDIILSIQQTLKTEIDKTIDNIIRNDQSINQINAIFDLRTYTTPIIINEKYYVLDSKTQKRLLDQYDKIKDDTHRKEKFIQMLNHSKALCKTYKF